MGVHGSGQWLVSCATDKTIKLWEVATTRCVRTLTFDLQPHQVSFSPNTSHSLLLLAVYVVGVGDSMVGVTACYGWHGFNAVVGMAVCVGKHGVCQVKGLFITSE